MGEVHSGIQLKTKVVGVTFDNEDGTDRQRYVKKCRVDDQLFLLPEPNNPHDHYAVAVYRKSWWGHYQQIGYLGRHISPDVSEHISSGGTALAQIINLTGGTRDKPARGVNIVVMLLED